MTDIDSVELYDFVTRTLYSSVEQAYELGYNTDGGISIASMVVFITGVQMAIDRPELAQAILDKWDAQITPTVRAGLDEVQGNIVVQ